jgi:tetratricopeptide (TPR) repeat protein
MKSKLKEKELKELLKLSEYYYLKEEYDYCKKILVDIINISSNNSRANELLAYLKGKEGNYEEAHLLLIKACVSDNCSAEAYYYLGTSFLRVNDIENAILNFEKSLKKSNGFFELYLDLGIAQARIDLYQESKNSFSKALKINKDSSILYYNMALLSIRLNEIEEAIYYTKEALNINYKFAEAWLLKGMLCKQRNEKKEALTFISKAIELSPEYVDAYCELASLLSEVKDYKKAILIIDKTIHIDPFSAKALVVKGNILQKQNLLSEAIEEYEKALMIDINMKEAYLNKGACYFSILNYEEAIVNYDKAISLDQKYEIAITNKGTVFNYLRKFKDAIELFNDVLKLNYSNAEAHFGLSYSYLQLLDFDKGWSEYEWRWRVENMELKKLKTTKPLWNGDINKPIRIFLWAEQGLGEQIMFSSILKEIGLINNLTTVAINKRLISIFERSYPNINFVSVLNIPEQEYDEQISLGSAVKFFKKNIRDFNKKNPKYLESDKSYIDKINMSVKVKGKLTCGISWLSYNKEFGVAKSIPTKELEPLLNIKNTNWINLQYKDKDGIYEDNELITGKMRTLPDLDLYSELDKLLALIDLCDVIVTCSNTVAHLAGALNKKTFLLLPHALGRLWHWQEVGGRSLWYPSIRIIHQDKALNWENAITNTKREIENSLVELDS